MNKTSSPGETLMLIFLFVPIIVFVIYGIYDWIREIIEKRNARRSNIPYKKRGSKKFFLIFAGMLVIQFFLLSLPFHYVNGGRYILLKENFTFNKTFVGGDDIDKIIKRYNDASLFEKAAIRNEPLVRQLFENEIIFETKTNPNNDDNK